MKKLLFGLVLSLSSLGATAAIDTQVWDFTHSGSANISGSSYGNTLSDNQGGVGLSATAWSDTDEGSTCTANPIWCVFGYGWTSYDNVESAKLASYGNYGLGVTNQFGVLDGHTVDNRNNIDMILLSFSEAVSFNSINIGWISGGSDITVAAFDNLLSNPNLDGSTWGNIASSVSHAWSFENVAPTGVNYDLTTGADAASTINSAGTQGGTAGVTSQYWLVGAYNNVFASLNNSADNTAIKIAGITTSTISDPSGNPLPVPEPASIAIFLVGLAGLLAHRKRLL